MNVTFSYMQTALDEMGYYILEEKRAAARESSELLVSGWPRLAHPV
jgi:hypothetical protein